MACKKINEIIQALTFSKNLGRKHLIGTNWISYIAYFVLRNNQCKMYSFVGVRKRKQLFHLQYERDGIARNELSQLGSHTNRWDLSKNVWSGRAYKQFCYLKYLIAFLMKASITSW